MLSISCTYPSYPPWILTPSSLSTKVSLKEKIDSCFGILRQRTRGTSRNTCYLCRSLSTERIDESMKDCQSWKGELASVFLSTIIVRKNKSAVCPAPKNNSTNAASIPNLVADPALHCRHHVLVSGRGFQLIILWSWISLVFGKIVLRKTLECPHCSRLTCFHWRPSQRQTFGVKRLQWFRHHNFWTD